MQRFVTLLKKSLPAVLLLATLWLWRENIGLQAELAILRAAGVNQRADGQRVATAPLVQTTTATGQVTAPSPPGPAKVATDAAATALLNAVKGEVVVSFGTVEQLGSQAAQFFANHEAQRLRNQASKLGIAQSTLSPEELLAQQRQAVEFLGALPEIQHFQDKPEEYGRFFRGLVETGGGVNAEQASQVESLMRSRSEEMIKRGLNAGNKPADGGGVTWEFNRDRFIEESADQLNDILPETTKLRFPINGSFMEFIEGDFDKSDIKPSAS